ncbi:class I SAM-dependent methyltransferase [Patescibacteria group bacterium]|nr:class I SAM-dependent methyltransferase [Patescibacteria group bacterium]MBU0845949.1 class I SAM-dependent methyltransferase [Patescibacteria group bacterium]
MTKNTKNSYQNSYKKYGIDPRALKWRSEKAAKQRYEQIVADIDFNNKSILDVGCGFGDIVPYVANKSDIFSYKEIDFVPEFISEAKKKYPKYTFLVGDYFKQPLEEEFDIIICCGALNGNYKNNLGFRKKTIKTMFNHTKECLVFNMAGRHPKPETACRSNVWFADSKEIFEYCETLSKKVLLKDDYHSNDFTIVMFKDNSI